MPLPPEPVVDAADPEFRAALADRLRRLLGRYRYAALEFDDLFQETVRKVISAVRSGQFSCGASGADEYRGQLLGFAYRCAANHLVSAGRKKRPLTNVDLSAVARHGLFRPAETGSVSGDPDLTHVWDAVSRAVDEVPPPPPRAFVRAWFDLRRAAEPVTEAHVQAWKAEFGKDRSTIRRWKRKVELQVMRRVVRPGREGQS